MRKFIHHPLFPLLCAVAVICALLVSCHPETAAASTYRCEQTKTGKKCATIYKPRAKSKTAREARRFTTARRLPITRNTTVKYLGYATKSLANGRDVYAIRSKVNKTKKRWHLWQIRAKNSCMPKVWEADAANHSWSHYDPTFAPTCEVRTWVLRVGDREINEDVYGWNCWTDGNADCGDVGKETADRCVTVGGDHYTMCADGRVYLLDGLRHVAELTRR